MLIGIDGSRAFIKNRTGIEEYSYQVIKNLTNELKDYDCFLYVRKNQIVDFELPEKWKIKIIKWPRFWTQLGLSLEILLHPVDVLFVPAHTVPMIHPEKTIVVVHGLEYEFCPSAYSFWDRIYMRVSIKNSCKWASRIISVSENTKKDLSDLYEVPGEKVKVIYEGYEKKLITNNIQPITEIKNLETKKSYQLSVISYLLFIGRIEERKNIINILKAFQILKEDYGISHKLVLAGKPGHGYENFKFQISNFKFKTDVLELGFVSEEKKWELLKGADVFVFPTLYEGFGIPILEAQSVGCPIVASNNSSIPEVVACHSGLDPESTQIPESSLGQALNQVQDDTLCSALLVNPESPQEIAENIYKIISDENLKNAIIQKGLENVKRFSWQKCAKEIAKLLIA